MILCRRILCCEPVADTHDTIHVQLRTTAAEVEEWIATIRDKTRQYEQRQRALHSKRDGIQLGKITIEAQRQELTKELQKIEAHLAEADATLQQLDAQDTDAQAEEAQIEDELHQIQSTRDGVSSHLTDIQRIVRA